MHGETVCLTMSRLVLFLSPSSYRMVSPYDLEPCCRWDVRTLCLALPATLILCLSYDLVLDQSEPEVWASGSELAGTAITWKIMTVYGALCAAPEPSPTGLACAS